MSGHPKKMITRATATAPPPPNNVRSRIDPSNVGTQKKTSAMREMTMSVVPPKNPAAPPSVNDSTTMPADTRIPTSKDVRVP